MRPGDTPLQSLINTVTRLGEGLSTSDDPIVSAIRADRIAHHLRASSHGIARALNEVDGTATRSIVLLVDQFEELFRFASSGFGPAEDARLREEAAQFVQLLLESSRSSTVHIHVVLTMRSDFIGDCARFHGLPEAVSATQFLVPSLTRDQREEIIRRPVELAGATIEASLVEQLLNDSGNELDQLPVLQHCLLRLWEQAGLREHASEENQPHCGRHISTQEYDQIHRISGALSQHADEILSTDLRDLEQAVERVFRALSELDRDGRATRRALSFQQLGAETAIDEKLLRIVLDRFRSDDCSFLTPSPATTPTLEPKTKVDVSHEALLRHWQSVSGVPGATGDKSDDRAIGWLREEHQDGQRYQALLAMAGGDDAEAALLPLDQVRRYSAWWNAVPRTEAWCQRYGGGHSRVAKLLVDSQAAYETQQAQQKQAEKSRRTAQFMRAAASVLVLLLFGASVVGYLFAQQYFIARTNERLASANERLAKATTSIALDTVRNTVDSIKQNLNYGRITVAGAHDLLRGVQTAFVSVPDTSTDVMALKANLLIAVSDALTLLGENKGALERAEEASTLAVKLNAVDPVNAKRQYLIFASAFRVADASLAPDLTSQKNINYALDRYQAAQAIVEKLSEVKSSQGKYLFDLAFIHNKVGETHQIQGDYVGALERFKNALDIAREAAKVDPHNITWQSYVPATLTKIAFVLAAQAPADFEGALANFASALSLQEKLLNQDPLNSVLLSQAANIYRGKADVLVARWRSGDFDEAVQAYSIAISLLSGLTARDQGNIVWLKQLALNYSHLGGAFEKAGANPSAVQQYEKALEVRRNLLKTDPGNNSLKKSFETSIADVNRLKVQTRAE